MIIDDIYIYIIPISILIIGYVFSATKPKKLSEYIVIIAKTLPYQYCYAFFLYYLEMEKIINVGWDFPTLMFFLVPISIIVLTIILIFWFKEKNKNLTHS